MTFDQIRLKLIDLLLGNAALNADNSLSEKDRMQKKEELLTRITTDICGAQS